VGVAGGGDLELGAHDQRVVELAGRAHARLRDRAAVRGDEVHQAEGQRLDAWVGRDACHLGQRAMGFDQCVQRDRAAQAVPSSRLIDR
jgi:hypothetical protein